jgi:hypothetical protein
VELENVKRTFTKNPEMKGLMMKMSRRPWKRKKTLLQSYLEELRVCASPLIIQMYQRMEFALNVGKRLLIGCYGEGHIDVYCV